MKQTNPFAKLTALDQKLYQETTPPPRKESGGFAGKPESQHASMPANQKTGKPESQHASMPANQKTGTITPSVNKTATEKVTYRFHAEGKYAVEDMKTILVRKHGIRASLEEIVETAILLTYKDLLENQHASKLATQLARTPENQKAR